MPPIVPLFEQRCKATFARAAETFRVRGDHYGDTWKNSQHLAVRAVIFALTGQLLPVEQYRAIASAVLVDLKYQRLEGGWDPDHLIDGINYQAFLADEMHQIYKENGSPAGGTASCRPVKLEASLPPVGILPADPSR